MDLKLLEFIRQTPDWETRLASEPYCIRIKRQDRFVLLKYAQAGPDFTIPIVRECRGIILDELDNFRPVCAPFFKFGNYGEAWIPEIDWKHARVQDKIDGSIIKLWHYGGQWRVSSNGEIDAGSAAAQGAYSGRKSPLTLRDLFWQAWDKTGAKLEALDPECTYMFELVSPYNRIIVRYEENEIWHIGTRNNRTLEELNPDIGVQKPREFPIGTLDEVITASKELGIEREGFVVVDGAWNRVKVKSPRYVALAHLLAGVSTERNIIEMIRKGETQEFLTYFPEFEPDIRKVSEKLDRLVLELEEDFASVLSRQFDDRKSLAQYVLTTRQPACMFSVIDGKSASVRGWVMGRPADRIVGMLERMSGQAL